MQTEFYTSELTKKELESLPPFHQLAFAAACCERLLPNYYIYAREQNRTDQKVLRKALDEIWQIISGKEMDISTISQLLAECDEIFPDEQTDYDSEYTGHAETACEAIRLILNFCIEPNFTKVIRIVSEMTNTLYDYLDIRFHEEQYPFWDEKPLSEQREIIATHLLSVREMAIQSEHLQRLKKQPILDIDILEWLRSSSYNEGKSLLDLA